MKLVGNIVGRLPADRRVGGAEPLAGEAMTRRARLQPPCRITAHVQNGRCDRNSRAVGRVGHAGVIVRNRQMLRLAEPVGDPAHLRMLPAPIGISAHLALEIADVEAGEPRRARAIAPSVQPMAGEAGVRRPGSGAAQRDQLAVRREAILR
jgi:hypothetical protein